MSNKNLLDGNTFYDCNTPDKVEGYDLIEYSDDVYKYKKIKVLNRLEVIGKGGREFSKFLKDSYYEISIQDNGRTIKLFEKN